MFGHMSDVGGKTACSMPTDARTIFEEGVVIPPFKLYSKGVLNEDALRIILNQVRQPDWNRADLNGIIAACRTASRRIQELCARFGAETYTSGAGGAAPAQLRRDEDAARRRCSRTARRSPSPTTSATTAVGYGPYKLVLSLTRTGEKVLLDFTGSDPQAQGPINYYINENLARMFFGIYLITVADPQILWNDGFYPLVDVRIPEAVVLEAGVSRPRSTPATTASAGSSTCSAGCSGRRRPTCSTPPASPPHPHFMYSGNRSDTGEWFQLYSIGFGGIPGRPIGDGPDGHSLWPSFTNIPCEFLESYYPLRIERWETVADTGGAGLHRGGNGVDVAYRFLEPGTIAIHDDRWLTYPWGVNGGEPGARGRKWIERADG